ncbi:MAG: hypothetical protein ACRC62_36190 [Microcoleus sp.]
MSLPAIFECLTHIKSALIVNDRLSTINRSRAGTLALQRSTIPNV